MPLTVKRYLISKKTVLALMILLFFSVVLSYAVPQQFSTPPNQFAKWQEVHQAWLPVTEFLGLHRLFTAPWFIALLFFFLVSLAITTTDQLRLAHAKTFGRSATHLGPSPSHGREQDAFPADLVSTEQKLTRDLRREGYFGVGENDGRLRFVKHPWGYWGKFLLHLGILITVASSLCIAATEKRGIVRLEEDKILLPGSPWLVEEHGLLAGPLQLDEALRLDRVTPEFWPNGGVKNVTSEVRFIAPDGETTSQTIAIAPILKYKGLRIYHENNFGNAFHVMLTDQAGQQGVMVLDIPSPFALGEASYGNFDFSEIPYHVKAKYYADADQKTLASDNPLLVVRLVDNTNTVIGELSLKKGGSGRLGPYQARLVEVKKWAGFIFLDTPFIPGVFLGFFIFILGIVLTYFTIPREFYCQRWGDGFRLSWKGPRWPQQYMAEYETVMKRLQSRERS